jgi:DNA-binding transcriptional MerR regulator
LLDLERLEQIVALRFLGVPLKQIAVLLNRDALGLHDALRMQLTILDDRRQLLEQAIGAIREAVTATQSGKPAEAEILKSIIGAITMQDNADYRKKYFSKESWAKLANLKKQSTPKARLEKSRAWITLYCDVEAARQGDPGSKKAQALAARWMKLVQLSSQGDPGIRAGWTKAWQDRQHWPARDRDNIASLNLEKIAEFIGQALARPRKKYFSENAWAKLLEFGKTHAQEIEGIFRVRVELSHDIRASLTEDPGSEKAQALVARWLKLSDIESDGDPEIKDGIMKSMADRKNWPAWVKREVASRYQMSFADFNRAADFIERALARSKNRAN